MCLLRCNRLDRLSVYGFSRGQLSCSASPFESTLKTICDKKGWTYNPDQDTLS